MSLILKQETASSVPTPPAGKGTVFLSTSDTLTVKLANGTSQGFATVGGSNTQILFNDAGAINGDSSFVFNKTNDTVTIANLSVTGTFNAGNIGITEIAYGTSNVDISQPNGNITMGVNGNANIFTATGSGVFVDGFLSATGNANVGNIGGFAAAFTQITGTLQSASQTNITAVGTLAQLSITDSITVGGNIAVTGYIEAANVFANTRFFTGGNANIIGRLTVGGDANIDANVRANGFISAAGNLTGGNIITAGIVSATGNVSGNYILGNGAFLTGISVDTTNISNGTANVRTFLNSNVTISASGNANVVVVTGTGLDVAGTVSASGNLTAGNIDVGGLITVTGNITGGNLVTSGAITATGNANVGNIGATSGVFTTIAGSLTTAAQPNITSLGTLSSLTVTNNANVGNLRATSIVTATGNITGGNLVTAGIVSANGATFSANVAMSNNHITGLAEPVNSSDAATKLYVDTIAEGLHVHDSCLAATQDTLANLSSGTVSYDNGTNGVGATLTTTGSYTTIDNVSIATVGTRILVKNEANAVWNGIYTYTSSTVLTRATDFDTTAEMAGGDFTFVTSGNLYADTGWVQTFDNPIVGTDPVIWTQFSGAGTYTAGTGLTLTGTVFSVNASQTQVTSVGTLSSLSVSGTANVGSLTVSGATSLGAVGNVTITGGTNGQYLQTNGSGVLSWQTVALGIGITDDITTNATYYPALTTATTGSISSANVSSTKLYFNPSSGALNATDFNSLSDERFKTNLLKLENTRQALEQLNGYSFDWKDGTGSGYGVLAQEVEKVMPHAVTGDEKKTVNYASILAFVLESVKDLYKEMDNLRTELNNLKNK